MYSICFMFILIVAVTDDDSRSHSPPPYVLHKKYAILPPPCPVYGIRQPTVLPGKSVIASLQSLHKA